MRLKLLLLDLPYIEIDDDYILDLCISKKTGNTNAIFIKLTKFDNKIKEYLDNRYNDMDKNDIDYKLVLYRIKNNILEVPKCPICGNPVGFKSITLGYWAHCSNKCAMNDETTKDTRKSTCLKKYGVEYCMLSDDIKSKSIKTCIEKYGVDNPAKNKEVIKKAEETSLKKYGVRHASLLETTKQKVKETCNIIYGYNAPSLNLEVKEKLHINLKEINQKIFETKKKNRSFNSSSIEKQFLLYLKDNFKNDFEYQYKSNDYPFNCDFYIKSLDLYIEIQGSWTHGGHAFNIESDKEQLDLLLEKSKYSTYYKNAIETWTVRDVYKRNIAKINNLRYLEIFSSNIELCIDILNQYINDERLNILSNK